MSNTSKASAFKAQAPQRGPRRRRRRPQHAGSALSSETAFSATRHNRSSHFSALDQSNDTASTRRMAASFAASLMLHGSLVAGLVGAPLASYMKGSLSGTETNQQNERQGQTFETVDLISVDNGAVLADSTLSQESTSEVIKPLETKVETKAEPTSQPSQLVVQQETTQSKPKKVSQAEKSLPQKIPTMLPPKMKRTAQTASTSNAPEIETSTLIAKESSEQESAADFEGPSASSDPNMKTSSNLAQKIQTEMQASANLETDPIDNSTKEAESVANQMNALADEKAAEKVLSQPSGATAAAEAANPQSSGGSQMAIASNQIREARNLRAAPGNPMPAYPSRDRLMRKQGTSVILGRISPDGRVTDVVLEQSSGSELMDQAAMTAFKKWKFQSGQEGWVRNPFQFKLVGEAQMIPASLRKQAITQAPSGQISPNLQRTNPQKESL